MAFNLAQKLAEQRNVKAREAMASAQAHGLGTPHGVACEREGNYWLFTLQTAQAGDTRAFIPPDQLVVVTDGAEAGAPCRWVDFLVENNGGYPNSPNAVSGGAFSTREILDIMATLQRGEPYRGDEGAGGVWTVDFAR